MKIKESEFKKLVNSIAEAKIKALKENADFTAARRINHMAAEAALDFEETILGNLNIVSPDEMSPELQDAYKNIMGDMQRKVCSAVIDALQHLQKFPRIQKDEIKS